MARCWSGLILSAYTFITLANAASTSLSQEITNFVPKCAQECFISFLDSNFPTSICSSAPTLECLCSHNGLSEFTVGEGAVQCIISEGNIGFCKGRDASNSVVLGAYSMCNGQNNALPNTHATIVATLIIPSSRPSIVLVPPSATAVASATPISTLITPIPTTTALTSPNSGPTSAALPSGLPSPSTVAQPVQTNSPIPPPTLTKPQIVGITVASIGGTALMLGVIALFACVRRKRLQKNRESDEFPFQLEPKVYAKSTKSSRFSLRRPKNFGPGGTSNGIAAKVAPPVPPRLDTTSPNMFSRRSIHQNHTIGLAISPEGNAQVRKQNRPSSRLLPPKPTLKLQMPQQAAEFSFAQTGPKPSAFNRPSPTAQYEVDYDGAGYQVPPPVPTLIGAGLSYPKPVLKQTTVDRQSTATQFEEDDENVALKSYAPNTRGGSFIQPISKFSVLGRQITAAQFVEDEEARNSNAAKRKTDLSRKSTATQFEEDEEISAISSAPRNVWTRRSTVEELDTAIELWQKFSPIDPAAGPPAFVMNASNKNPSQQRQLHSSNSRPAELEGSPVTPVSLVRGIGSFSQPRRPNDYPRLKQPAPELGAFPKPPQHPPKLQIPASTTRPITATSSVYSTRTSSLPASPAKSNPPNATVPAIPKICKQEGPYDAPETVNRKTSESKSPGLSPNGPRTAELSPVLESPSSGRSPVSYPKIPKPGRLSAAEIRMVPPPPQPKFSMAAEKPWIQAEIAAQRERQSRQESPQQQYSYQTFQSPRLNTSFQSDSQRSAVDKYYIPSPLSPASPRDLSSLPSQSQRTSQGSKQFQASLSLAQKPGLSSQVQSRPPRTSPSLQQGPNRPQLTTNPSIAFRRSSSGLSQISELSSESKPSSISSGQSHLAQRRRGEQKAAALVLPSQSEQKLQQKKKWMVLKEEDVDKAKSDKWRPMLAQQHVEQVEPFELPGTPGWVPRLTPTRRGEELFLSVG
ncbi:uncharacterized protein BP5553_03332 [Venustampulla echinocandica]|uniref:CFEM domain-containing protein n=1 Tax=Venustampulla echinocandica TaxID=2656787 RepID=A0A370TTY4_9HELO|nr:uncharacterized protein BP5553_03332 [Venustampulla echinocandica]RDL38992.1 hypothetical protein BP5553_03332 [Venustampulla echinocandica]